MESNTTLKLSGFYKLIKAEYVLTVHLDSYFLQKIPDWIFTGTFYASPVAWNINMAGCGGLSVRHIKNIILINKVAPNEEKMPMLSYPLTISTKSNINGID